MSEENVELIARVFPESGPANLGVLLSILDEHVEWDYIGAFPESTTYRGPEEVSEYLAEWSEAFDDFGVEAEEIIDAGESVIVLIHQWGRGKDTGAPVESRTWQVLAFRSGKVTHCRGYASKAAALEAAGLSE
jgi:ketosteroid isomerase-like protein